MPQADQRHAESRLLWVGLRVLWRIAALLALALGVHAASLALDGDARALTIGWAILIVLPFSIGALGALVLEGPWNARTWTWLLPPVLIVVTILVVGAAVLREGLICIAMLMPVRAIAGLLGATFVTHLFKKFSEQHQANIVVLAMLPFAALFADASLPQPAERFTVARAITIDANAETIWPHLLKLDELDPQDGVWTCTQDVLGVPRPSSAVVLGDGAGSTRLARWGRDIRFEERITGWRANKDLRWDFAFPDDSISRYTDPHIHPDGAHLKIESGRYWLAKMADGRTKLTLETQYVARTPINFYAAMWGELALGDIQTNILAIVKQRAEDPRT